MRLPIRVPPARPTTTRPLTIAHRGASASAPENTLAAVRRAVVDGADLVEVDVQRTRDGALVLVHDVTLERTTDVAHVLPGRAPWRVGDLTLAELRRLDAGSWKGRAFAGEPVPTLDELIDLLAVTGTGLQLELKLPGLHPGIVEELAAALACRWDYVGPTAAEGRLAVQSFAFAAMKELKTRLPDMPVGLLGRPPRAHLPALATWADQVNPRHVTADPAYVRAVHEAGMRCMVWTVDRSYAVRRAVRNGVDGVITNRPGIAAGIA
jgi:glycerophosphoryl diester phosphodiesterase